MADPHAFNSTTEATGNPATTNRLPMSDPVDLPDPTAAEGVQPTASFDLPVNITAVEQPVPGAADLPDPTVDTNPADDQTTWTVLSEVAVERRRQDEKWGQQNHVSLDPVLLGRPGGCTPERMAQEYEIPSATRAKSLCQCRGAGSKPDTWGHILVEELAEAIEAGVVWGEGAEMRAELIQTAAVAVAWVECIDRRAEKDRADG